jgi:hypothetical protein
LKPIRRRLAVVVGKGEDHVDLTTSSDAAAEDPTEGGDSRPGKSPGSPGVAAMKRRQQKTKPIPSAGKRKRKERKKVPRARLLDLAARYKANHEQFQSLQQQVPNDVELLCSGADGAVLVKWAGHEVPTWEPAAAIPAATREDYRRQGRVELREYMALLEVAC